MSYLVGIDPGTRALGACLFQDGRLVSARASVARGIGALPSLVAYHAGNLRDYAGKCPEVAIELMRWRPKDPRSQANDLIDVQTVGMVVAGSCRNRIHLYPATTWKGSVPKPVHHKRIREALELEEARILDAALSVAPARHRKEILDALGIGLFHLKRTNRSGIRRK